MRFKHCFIRPNPGYGTMYYNTIDRYAVVL